MLTARESREMIIGTTGIGYVKIQELCSRLREKYEAGLEVFKTRKNRNMYIGSLYRKQH